MSDPAQPRRSWWSRNWKWVVPVGILVPVLACGGCFGAIFAIVSGAIKTSGAYTESLALVQNDSEVQQALGTPIEAGFMVSGEISVNNASGTADISYSVSGPSGSATVYVDATMTNDVWSFNALDVVVDETSARINLLE